jgi:predicted CoA-binding protein
MASLKSIEDFLGLKRIAVVGLSRNPKDFTRSLFRELLKRGYDAVPVNPNLWEADGVTCFRSIGEVAPAVEGALLLTSPAVTDEVVKDCARAGIRHVWMYRGAGTGAVSRAASQYCASQGISVVEGECPFMFLPRTGLPHRIHGFCRKLVGSYPR